MYRYYGGKFHNYILKDFNNFDKSLGYVIYEKLRLLVNDDCTNIYDFLVDDDDKEIFRQIGSEKLMFYLLSAWMEKKLNFYPKSQVGYY